MLAEQRYVDNEHRMVEVIVRHASEEFEKDTDFKKSKLLALIQSNYIVFEHKLFAKLNLERKLAVWLAIPRSPTVCLF